jgi:hypothetical protein
VQEKLGIGQIGKGWEGLKVEIREENKICRKYVCVKSMRVVRSEHGSSVNDPTPN